MLRRATATQWTDIEYGQSAAGTSPWYVINWPVPQLH